MVDVIEAAVVAREDVLARTAAEADQKAFDADSASLDEFPQEVLFSDEIKLNMGRAAAGGKGPGPISEGRSQFERRGL